MKARLPQGYGKQSQQQLMQQVQQMQENMRLKQEELENTEYSVTSGGGMVELHSGSAASISMTSTESTSSTPPVTLTSLLKLSVHFVFLTVL